MVRISFQIQQRIFSYLKYTVLVKEIYAPYDWQGRPSHFGVIYAEDDAIIPLLSRIMFEEVHKHLTQEMFDKYKIRMFIIVNGKGLFSIMRGIDWAVEEAKKRIE